MLRAIRILKLLGDSQAAKPHMTAVMMGMSTAGSTLGLMLLFFMVAWLLFISLCRRPEAFIGVTDVVSIKDTQWTLFSLWQLFTLDNWKKQKVDWLDVNPKVDASSQSIATTGWLGLNFKSFLVVFGHLEGV